MKLVALFSVFISLTSLGDAGEWISSTRCSVFCDFDSSLQCIIIVMLLYKY